MDKLNLKCYILYETKELLTITKMYITVLNTFMFIISIAIVITTIIIIIIRITVNTISIIIVFAKSPWRYVKSGSYPAILVSHDFWRQIFAHIFFI